MTFEEYREKTITEHREKTSNNGMTYSQLIEFVKERNIKRRFHVVMHLVAEFGSINDHMCNMIEKLAYDGIVKL